MARRPERPRADDGALGLSHPQNNAEKHALQPAEVGMPEGDHERVTGGHPCILHPMDEAIVENQHLAVAVGCLLVADPQRGTGAVSQSEMGGQAGVRGAGMRMQRPPG